MSGEAATKDVFGPKRKRRPPDKAGRPRRVLEALAGGELSTIEVTARAGLSGSTFLEVVAPLIEQGIVSVERRRVGSRGSLSVVYKLVGEGEAKMVPNSREANGHGVMIPPPRAAQAAVVHGSEELLARNGILKKLLERGVAAKKVYEVRSGAGSTRLDYSSVDLVVYVEDAISGASIASIREGAKVQGKPCFALKHTTSHGTWSGLSAYLLSIGVAPRAAGPEVVEVAAGPRREPSTTAEKIARSIEDTEEIARLAMEDAEAAKANAARLRRELEAAKLEVDGLRHATAAQVRDGLMLDVARKEQERKEANARAASIERDLTERLAAEQALRSRERQDAARDLRRMQDSRDQLAEELRKLKAGGSARGPLAARDLLLGENEELKRQLLVEKARAAAPLAEVESALKRVRWAVDGRREGMLDDAAALAVVEKAVGR